VKTVLKQVWKDPAGPIHWGKNQAGMQAHAQLTGWRRKTAGSLWRLAGRIMCIFAWTMMKVGLHKQVANRLLEPWQYITVLITSTEWDNFMELRDHPDAQPEMRELAVAINNAMHRSTPTMMEPGVWHLPFVNDSERANFRTEVTTKLSTARCARTSYLTHDKKHPSAMADIELHDKLVVAKPRHASPSEHQCTPDKWIEGKGWEHPELHGNLRGYIQYRKIVEAKQ
jgi:hypothetical protein